MDNDRVKHSISVARRMVEIGKSYNLSNEELEELFVLGLNHDIGYEFCDGRDHNVVGGNILKRSNYKYWREVYYHGVVQDEYSSLYLKILNTADMQVDKYGNVVGFEERLKDIKSRYGEDSVVYKRCVLLIEFIKSEV